MRDGDKTRFCGKGVLNAVNNVNTVLHDNIIGMEVEDQRAIDEAMLKLDGTKTKSNLGANAILGVSMACLKAAANNSGKPFICLCWYRKKFTSSYDEYYKWWCSC